MCFAVLLLVPVLTSSGCGRSPALSLPDLNEITEETALDGASGSIRSDQFAHDFGAVLARGQVLRHTFALTNRTVQPIKIVRAIALTPCCSEIGPVPDQVIAPGAEGRIPVTLSVVDRAERRRVEFIVETNQLERPALRYVLLATIYPEWEVRPFTTPPQILTINRPGAELLRLIARRLDGAGESLPSIIEAEPPLIASFLDEFVEQTNPEGVKSSWRDARIIMPASSQPGVHRGVVRLRWSDGKVRKHDVCWQVVPPIGASPTSILMDRSTRHQPHTVRLRCEERAFRIVAVDRPPLVHHSEFSPQESASHSLKLWIDADAVAREKEPTITIRTDHPDQPTLALRVLALPTGE